MNGIDEGTALTFTKTGHAYAVRYPNGTTERVRSVTAISGAGRAPALERWNATITAECVARDWDDLERLDPVTRLDRMRNYSRIESSKAAVRGTTVHEYAEALVAGAPVFVPDDPDTAAMIEAYARWLDQPAQRWLLNTARTETRLLIPAARGGLPPVAGTADIIAADDRGRRIIADLKTKPAGKTTPRPEWAPQLWAYGLGHEVGDDGIISPTPPPRAHAGTIIIITPAGVRQVWLRGASWRRAGRVWQALRTYQATPIRETDWEDK